MKCVVAVLAGLLGMPLAAQAQGGTWTDREEVPASAAGDRGGRAEHGAAGYGGRVYVFGGWSDAPIGWGGRVVPTGVYDPVTDSWTMAAGPRVWRSQAGAAALGGRIYLVGGFGDNYLATAVCESYDPATDTWADEDFLDGARGMVGVAAVGSRIHAVGGLRNGTSVADHEVFDPSSGSWNSAAAYPLSSGISGPAAAGLDGRLYLFGGFVNFVGISSDVRSYDPATDAWASPVDMGTLGRGVSVAVVGRRIYVFGGEGSGQVLGYRPSTGTVISGLTSFYPGRTNHTTVTAGSSVYLMGGEDDGGYRLNLNQEYRPPAFGEVPTIADLRQRQGFVDVPQGALVRPPLDLVAVVQDADGVSETVEFEVRPAAQGFTGEPTHVAPAAPAGSISYPLSGLAPGDYTWRARVIDDQDNVSDWLDFGSNGGPDFRVDAEPPSVPEPLVPDGGTWLEDRRVRLVWSASTDASGIEGYRVQVSADPAFPAPLVDTFVTSTEAFVGVPDGTLYWRVLARDNSGLESDWSRLAMFRVEDGTDHAAGDAQRVCGFGSAGASIPAAAWIAMLALLGRRPWRRAR